MIKINNKGFTLLELLMVIIVIGILASVAIPQYQNFIEKARASEAVNFIGQIIKAEELVKLETDNYTYILGDLLLEIPADNTTHWNYTIGNPPPATSILFISAQRTNLDATASIQGTNIMWFIDVFGVDVWSGTHPGVPST